MPKNNHKDAFHVLFQFSVNMDMLILETGTRVPSKTVSVKINMLPMKKQCYCCVSLQARCKLAGCVHVLKSDNDFNHEIYSRSLAAVFTAKQRK